MVANYTILQPVDLYYGTGTKNNTPTTLMLPGDNKGHVWTIPMLSQGMPADITETVTANGYFQRADGNVVLCPGTVTGNVVTVTLLQACYAIEGNMLGVVRVTNATTGMITTLCEANFRVSKALNNEIIDPGEVIPDIDNLLAQIAAMEAATAAANTAASNANRAMETLPNILIGSAASPNWVRGSIRASDGANMSSTTRLRSGYILPNICMKIDLPDGMKAYTYRYTEAAYTSFIADSRSGWQTGSIIMPGDGTYYRIVLGYTSDAEIAVSAANDVTVTVYDFTDTTLTMSGKAADAAAVANAIAAESTKALDYNVIIPAINLFVPDTVTLNKGLGTDGRYIETTFAQENLCVSDVIRVVPGQVIHVSPVLDSQQFANIFQSQNGNLVAGYLSDASHEYLTVPADAYYMRCTLRKDALNTFSVTIKNMPVHMQDMDETLGMVGEAFSAIEDPFTIDATTITADSRIRVSDGAIVTRAGSFVSGFIAVKPGNILVLNWDLNSQTYGHRFYAADQRHAVGSAVPSDAANRSITVPTGAAYIRVTGTTANLDTYRIQQLTPAENSIFQRVDEKDSALQAQIDSLATLPEQVEYANPYKRFAIKGTSESVDGYTHCAFPSICFFGGKEIIAYRAGMSHYTPTDSASWGGIALDTRMPDGTYTHVKILKTSDFTGMQGELRDPQLGVSRDGQYLVIAAFTTYTLNGADAHENVLICLNAALEVVDYKIDANVSAVYWGNPLFTPNGHIIVTGYGSSTVYLYRSTTAFSTGVSGLTMETAATLVTTNTSSEACAGYYNDYLVVLVRRQAVASCTVRTENLEGTDGWSNPKAISPVINIHAPRLLPYSTGKYLLFSGAVYVNSSNRYPGIGLLDITTSPATLVCVGNVDPDLPQNYGGYNGIVARGGDEYDIVYYQEGSGDLHSQGSTGMYYKRVNLRELLPQTAYLLPVEMQ